MILNAQKYTRLLKPQKLFFVLESGMIWECKQLYYKGGEIIWDTYPRSMGTPLLKIITNLKKEKWNN